MNDYGKNIKNARKKAGLTQKELAEASGVAKVTIQQYETGKRQPRLEQLSMLAEAMQVHMDELLGTKPLPSRAVVINEGFPCECIETEDGAEIESMAAFFFLDELGYKMFNDPRIDDMVCEDATNQRILYDCRDNKAYSVTWDELEKVRENVISYAKFQMNELLMHAKIADVEEFLDELREWKEIPPRQEAQKGK